MAYIWTPSLVTLATGLLVFFLGFRLYGYIRAKGLLSEQRSKPATVRRPDAQVFFSCPRCRETLQDITRNIGAERACPTCGKTVTVANKVPAPSTWDHDWLRIDLWIVQIAAPALSASVMVWFITNRQFGLTGIFISGLIFVGLLHLVRWIPPLLYNSITPLIAVLVGVLAATFFTPISGDHAAIVGGVIYMFILFQSKFGSFTGASGFGGGAGGAGGGGGGAGGGGGGAG